MYFPNKQYLRYMHKAYGYEVESFRLMEHDAAVGALKIRNKAGLVIYDRELRGKSEEIWEMLYMTAREAVEKDSGIRLLSIADKFPKWCNHGR